MVKVQPDFKVQAQFLKVQFKKYKIRRYQYQLRSNPIHFKFQTRNQSRVLLYNYTEIYPLIVKSYILNLYLVKYLPFCLR